MDRKRLIRITKNKVYLTPQMSLSLSQTSLLGKDLTFRTVEDIFFEVEVLEYQKPANLISLTVTNYRPKNIEQFKQQSAKAPISFIRFSPLKWKELERHLSSYTKGRLIKEKIVIDESPQIPNKTNSNNNDSRYEVSLQQVKEDSNDPLIEKILEETKVYFKDADFNVGFVSFPCKSKKLNRTFNLKIENHFILSEFNAIKSYFPRAFNGKKQFTVSVIYTLTDKVVSDILTKSPEIESINESMIDSIKRDRIEKLTTNPVGNLVDKSLFTAEDIFDSFEENLESGNVFKHSEEDILNFLIETRNIRNAKHLQYLSGSKHSTKQKLRFTLKPLFGFLFFIEGETKNHFCWELLDSHATYLWSFNKIESDIEFQFKRIEETVNAIRLSGRESYKRNHRINAVDKDLTFHPIEHNNAKSAFVEGFVEWRHKLDQLLV